MTLTQRRAAVVVTLLCALLIANILYNSRQHIVSEVVFTDMDEQQHKLSDYKGKPILVTFWATDCPSCIGEIPLLIKLYNDFSPQGLIMLAIAMPHDRPQRINIMRANRRLPYLIAWDKNAAISQAFGNIRVTPTHFFISPDGKIIMRKIGELDADYLYEKLTKMGLTLS